MSADNFFVYCPEDGFEAFETLDEALDDANEKIKGYLDDDGWSEDVTGVCAGKITHKAKMCDQVFPVGKIDEDGLDEAGDYWDPDWGYKCNYKMMPTEPAHDVAGLVEALESAKNLIANHSGEVLTDEYAGDQIEQIDAALAAYRKPEVEK